MEAEDIHQGNVWFWRELEHVGDRTEGLPRQRKGKSSLNTSSLSQLTHRIWLVHLLSAPNCLFICTPSVPCSSEKVTYDMAVMPLWQEPACWNPDASHLPLTWGGLPINTAKGLVLSLVLNLVNVKIGLKDGYRVPMSTAHRKSTWIHEAKCKGGCFLCGGANTSFCMTITLSSHHTATHLAGLGSRVTFCPLSG
jgi:hypothetical protein